MKECGKRSFQKFASEDFQMHSKQLKAFIRGFPIFLKMKECGKKGLVEI